jgi:hypothetical protein
MSNATIKLFAAAPRVVHVDKDDPACSLLAEMIDARSFSLPIGLREPSEKLLASAPATMLLWEPWRCEYTEESSHPINKHDAITKFLEFAVSFPTFPVHHANRSLSALWVAGQECERCNSRKDRLMDRVMADPQTLELIQKRLEDDVMIEHGKFEDDQIIDVQPCKICHGTRYIGITGEGRDAAGNSVRLELPVVKIGYLVTQKTVRNEDRGSFNYGAAGYMDCLQWPPRLITAPMQVKVRLRMADPKQRLYVGETRWELADYVSATVSLPSLVVRHPLFPCEGEGAWSESGELK